MGMIKLTVPTNERDKFYQALSYIKHIPPLSLLRKRELEVFAELLYYNNKYKAYPQREKSIMVSSTEIKSEICERIGTRDKRVYYTITSGLRKKGLINDDDTVVQKYMDIIGDPDGITINFKYGSSEGKD